MHHNTVLKRLCGPTHLKVRKLYRALLEHHYLASCSSCTSYHRYGCTIVRGDLLEHIKDVANLDIDMEDLDKLKDAEIIEIREISTNQHKLTFMELQEEE